MQTISNLRSVFYSVGLIVLVYVGFLLREFNSTKATGIGVFPKVLVDPWFWVTAMALIALMLWWKSRWDGCPTHSSGWNEWDTRTL
jgi:hypothetical protein